MLLASVALAAEIDETRALLQNALRERYRQMADEPADERSLSLIAQRQAAFEGYGRLARRSGDPNDMVQALYALADLEQVSVTPVREVSCPAQSTLASCLVAYIGWGPLFTTGSTFTLFSPAGGETQIVSGVLQDDGKVRLEAAVRNSDPLLAELATKLEGVHPMEPPSVSTFAEGGRLRGFYVGWLLEAETGDLALCETEQGVVSSRSQHPIVELVTEEWISQRLYAVKAQRMPCAYGFAIGDDLGVSVGTKRLYAPGELPIYLAADLNGDGRPDFVIHTGSEGCEEDTLWLSDRQGWTAVAMFGGCC